jgi:hypothetical protein
MAFSGMSSREKTVIVVLGVVILIALVGIGILVARLITGGKASEQTPEIAAGATSAPGTAGPEATMTMVATPSLTGMPQTTPQPVSEQPVAVGRQESPGPGLPVILANQPLYAGRRYRLEIAAADGSSVAIQGSWSQAATSAGGTVAFPQVESLQGTTPVKVDIVAPVADPTAWSMSASAGPKDMLGNPVILVITVYDVTGTQ